MLYFIWCPFKTHLFITDRSKSVWIQSRRLRGQSNRGAHKRSLLA